MFSICYYFEKTTFTNDINVKTQIPENLELQIDTDKLFLICKNSQ